MIGALSLWFKVCSLIKGHWALWAEPNLETILQHAVRWAAVDDDDDLNDDDVDVGNDGG